MPDTDQIYKLLASANNDDILIGLELCKKEGIKWENIVISRWNIEEKSNKSWDIMFNLYLMTEHEKD